MPLVETAASSSNSNNEQNQREQSRERRQPRKSESEELPLTFASFYYSLKVSRGKGKQSDVQLVRQHGLYIMEYICLLLYLF